MGLFNTIGKMAGSKVLEKVTDEFTKKQNREQSGGYCNYVRTNLARICKMLAELEGETKALISNVSSAKGVKLTFKEKGEARKTKEKAEKREFFSRKTLDFYLWTCYTISNIGKGCDEDGQAKALFRESADGASR